MNLIVIAISVAWTVCAVLTYGILFAHAQLEWPSIAVAMRRSDRLLAGFFAAFGPFGLIPALLGTGFAVHGLLYRAKVQG